MKSLISFMLVFGLFASYHPSNESLHQEAKKLKSEGFNNEAIKIYQALLTSDPQDSIALLNLGICYYNEKQYDQAFQILNQVVQKKIKMPGNFDFLLSDAALHIMLNFGTFAEAQAWAACHDQDISNYQFLTPQDISFADGFSGPLLFLNTKSDDQPHAEYLYSADHYFSTFDDFMSQCKTSKRYDYIVSHPATFGECGFNLYKAFQEKNKQDYNAALEYIKKCPGASDDIYIHMMRRNMVMEACRYFLFFKAFDDAQRALNYALEFESSRDELGELYMEVRACKKRQDSIRDLLNCHSYQDVEKLLGHQNADRHTFLSPLDIRFIHIFQVQFPQRFGGKAASGHFIKDYQDYHSLRNDPIAQNGGYEASDDLAKTEILSFPKIKDEEAHAFRGECGFLLLKAFDMASRSDICGAVDIFTRAFNMAPESWLVKSICANGIRSVFSLPMAMPNYMQIKADSLFNSLPAALSYHVSTESLKSHLAHVQRQSLAEIDHLLKDVADYPTAKSRLESAGLQPESFPFLRVKDIFFDEQVYGRLDLNDLVKNLRNKKAILPFGLGLRSTEWYFADTTVYTDIFMGEVGFYLRKGFEWRDIPQSIDYFEKARAAAPQHEYAEMFYYDALLHAINYYQEDGNDDGSEAMINRGLEQFPNDLLLTVQLTKQILASNSFDPDIYKFAHYAQAVDYMKNKGYNPDTYGHFAEKFLCNSRESQILARVFSERPP